MIKIVFRNGNVYKWKKKTYTDYMYDGKFFIVIRGKQWVGFYNLKDISEIVVNS